MQFFGILALCLSSWAVCATALYEQVVLRAVRGRDAVLPCGQGKVFLDGPDSYVLWMKNNKEFLYRYPNEDTTLEDQIFESPCETGSCPDPTSLKLKRVGDTDNGVYRCRVHYQASPAVDFVIDLRLVDSPGLPRIYNAEGAELTGHVSQLSLGSNMVLVCQLEDDQPGTLLWWERNGEVLERMETIQQGMLKVTAQVGNVTREELNAHYECLAQNADVTDPSSASVVVKMHLPPLSVEVRVNNNLNFEAGQPRVVDCVVVGCVPPPTITWHLGNVMLRPSVHKELHDGNFTVSSLTLVPALRDDKQELVCRAQNSHLPGKTFEDKVVLNVGFRPTCLNDHEEIIGYVAGQTESVTCTVDAYPEPLQFSWTFADTKTLYTSVKKVSGHQHRFSSSLTWKPQEDEQGELLCRAINVLGEQKSPCVYSVVAGGPPMIPECEFKEAYPKTFKISCKKSWDGGRPQTIHLELQNLSGSTLSNITDKSGHFSLPDLQKLNVTAVIYASNSRGRSDARILTLSAMDVPADNVTATPTPREEGMLIIAIVSGTFAICTIVGLLARCISFLTDNCRAQHNNNNNTNEEELELDGLFRRDPDVQVIAMEGGRHATIRISSHEVLECPAQNLNKAGRLLGFGAAPREAYYV